MKKLFVMLFVILIALLLIYGVKQNKDEAELNNKGLLDHSTIQESIHEIEVAKEQVYKGNLLLVNKEYPVHQAGVKTDIIQLSKNEELVNGYRLLDSNIYVSKSVARLFMEMVNDAQKDKVSHFIINSGYRSFEEQSQLFEEKGAEIAMPEGYSEHQLGLALDIGSTRGTMHQTPEGNWLKKNAWRYGFTLRYPENKIDITGTQYEPWHYRYVGLPHSAIMNKNNFVVEEYLDYLKQEKKISMKIDGKKYEVLYYKVSRTTAIKVPVDRHYDISGNNVDGIIVTIYA